MRANVVKFVLYAGERRPCRTRGTSDGSATGLSASSDGDVDWETHTTPFVGTTGTTASAFALRAAGERGLENLYHNRQLQSTRARISTHFSNSYPPDSPPSTSPRS